MPFIRIQLIEGRTPEQKATAASQIAAIASKELNTPIENVKVIFEDMPKENYYPAGNKIG